MLNKWFFFLISNDFDVITTKVKFWLCQIAVKLFRAKWWSVHLASEIWWKILKYITLRQNLICCRWRFNHFSCWFFFSTKFFFIFYSLADSAFTERILGLPNENYKGYVEADATQRARHIPSNSFFLIHGLADSSAPYLHGTQLARALAKAGIIFQYQVSWNLIFFYF